VIDPSTVQLAKAKAKTRQSGSSKIRRVLLARPGNTVGSQAATTALSNEPRGVRVPGVLSVLPAPLPPPP
jgi:hypothetical protein